MKKWTARAKDLKLEEEKFRERMPGVRNVLGDKRWVLFKEILDDLNYPDSQLIDDIAGGFKLSGCITKSTFFHARSKKPAFSWRRSANSAFILSSSFFFIIPGIIFTHFLFIFLKSCFYHFLTMLFFF